MFTYLVPPQILPFDFGNEPLDAGDLTSIQCVVSKGDYPINLTWTFNGEPIRDYNAINIAQNNKKVSTLTIESAEAFHSGNYSCVATNLAGSVSHTSTLIINGDCFHVSFVLNISFTFFLLFWLPYP